MSASPARRKLIEVALPIDAISTASKRDKDRKVGTIKNVHKWFAPMPTPAWRALLFAALVDDPGEGKRGPLLSLVERLVPADGSPPPEHVLAEARRLIHKSTGGDLPTVLDPFCGGGSTLVEAQRLGLPVFGSDLNPVPALISRILVDVVPRVAGRAPLVGDPGQLGRLGGGSLGGFLADVRHYSERVGETAQSRVGRLYQEAGDTATVVAWIWCWTVTCPNPICRATAPLVSSFWLSKKKGSSVWIQPHVLLDRTGVRFEVESGNGQAPRPSKTGRGGNFDCLVCNEPIPEAWLKREGDARRLGLQLMASAVETQSGREYYAPERLSQVEVDRPADPPENQIADDSRALWCKLYGLSTVGDLFTNRQLAMLNAFSEAVAQVPEWVTLDGGDIDYAHAIASVLGLCVGKLATVNSVQSRWYLGGEGGSTRVQAAFSRQALPMVWDFVELNPFSPRAANWPGIVDSLMSGLRALPSQAVPGQVMAGDARTSNHLSSRSVLLATDPPYFAQIGYADLSDFFYVWLRRALREVHPDLFATMATPKADELIAAPHRHGGSKKAAYNFFVNGFTETFRALLATARPDLPIIIIYAHRQEQSGSGEESATAWDAMLAAILAAGLGIVGTWPIHATSSSRQTGLGTNALASYVVLVCRPRSAGLGVTDRQSFVGALRAELPGAIKRLQESSISAIDLGQAAIGPGMAVLSRYARVIEPDGSNMSVARALDLIAQVRAEVVEDFVGDPGNETRWAMTWFHAHGFDDGSFDDAEKLFKTTRTSLEGLDRAGIIGAGAGKVRLLDWRELPEGWDPDGDRWRPLWETTLHLVKRLQEGGEASAAALLRQVRDEGDAARELAYWVVDRCQFTQKGEVGFFDELITSWPRIAELAAEEEPGELTLPV